MKISRQGILSQKRDQQEIASSYQMAMTPQKEAWSLRLKGGNPTFKFLHKTPWLIWFGLSLILLPVTSAADEILLKNGDRFTGEIVRMEKDLLVIKMPYAEEDLRIDWLQVDCIVSERGLTTEFRDYEVLVGAIKCPEPGKFEVTNGLFGKSVLIPLSELLAINPATYKGYFTLGGSLNSGNTDTKAINLATLFQVRTSKHRFTAEGKHNFSEASGTTTARNSSGSLKYDLFTTEKIYSYAQSLTEQDSLANLNLRNTEGLGFGYQIFDSRRISHFLELGLSFLNEDVAVGEDRSDAAGRWAVGLDWEVIPKRLKVFHHQEGYYSFIGHSVSLRSDQGFRLPLYKNLSANLEFDYRYNSKPEPGTGRSDIYLIVGLTYEYAYW